MIACEDSGIPTSIASLLVAIGSWTLSGFEGEERDTDVVVTLGLTGLVLRVFPTTLVI